MIIARTIQEVRSNLQGKIGFVPTMGAFHEGHLQLMRRAKELSDFTVVSLFVNPLQFGPKEDLSSYPRNEERDFDLARNQGVDLIFAPDANELLADTSTVVNIPKLSECWEGKARPGHFDGVATIVCKLFNIISPQLAVFGEKDFQQCAVIKKMVYDLNMQITLQFEPTIREPDGLALSSRNAYLSTQERATAPKLFAALKEAKTRIQSSQSMTEIDAALEAQRGNLNLAGFNVDYLEYIDSETLEPLDSLAIGGRLIVAAKLGTTRLIDNIAVD